MKNTERKTRRPIAVRLFAFIVFIFAFTRELLSSNVAVARTVLFQPVSALSPGFISYRLDGLSDFEIVVLTHCITLTPGTTSVEVSPDHTELVVHALDARDPQDVCASIKAKLEAPMLAWTR
jgi:multisubunit Na+/H+ antiporter MnhE subunit